MTINFINQENEEITKIVRRTDSYKIQGKYMAVELPSVVLLLILNWYICFHSSEKYLWIEILKPQPPKNMEVC